MSDQIADPEQYFAIELHLAAVKHEDYAKVHAALIKVRNKYSRGGSSVSVERVAPRTVVNR